MNASKKIIFINKFFAPDYSASAQILSDLVFHLAKEGYTVKVIASSGFYEGTRPDLAKPQTLDGVEILRVYRPRFSRHQLIGRAVDYFFMHFTFAVALLKLVNEGDVVVAKTDPPMLSITIGVIAKVKGSKIINWLQDIFPEVASASNLPFVRAILNSLVSIRDLSLRRAFVNVVVGNDQRSLLLKQGIAPQKIVIIHNWSGDYEINPECHESNALRSAWGLEGKFVIGYSGNLGRAHEFETLLNAARRFRGRDDIVFQFIGGGALLPQFIRGVEKDSLQTLFRFAPYQANDQLRLSLTLPDVHWISLRPEMDGLVVPSKFYGICAAGRPIIFIGNSRNELARLVLENDCGAVVENGNDEKLAEVIGEFLGDREKVKRLGSNARTLLDARFSRRHALEKWTETLHSALAQNKNFT
jgi:colanic acid biosynthesis glycosyl transferase WcaI